MVSAVSKNIPPSKLETNHGILTLKAAEITIQKGLDELNENKSSESSASKKKLLQMIFLEHVYI